MVSLSGTLDRRAMPYHARLVVVHAGACPGDLNAATSTPESVGGLLPLCVFHRAFRALRFRARKGLAGLTSLREYGPTRTERGTLGSSAGVLVL